MQNNYSLLKNLDEKKLKTNIEKALNTTLQAIKKGDVCVNKPLCIYFEIPNVNSTGRFIYYHMQGDPDDIFTMVIGVHKNGDDREMSVFIFMGTNEEFCNTVFKDNNSLEQHNNTVKELVKRVFDFDK